MKAAQPSQGDRKNAASKARAQSFEDAARELGCDEDEARFSAALGKIAGAKPVDPPARKQKRASSDKGQVP